MSQVKDISAESTMQDVLQAYPGAQRALMRRYHIGGCSSCGFTLEETLGQVLQRHNQLNTDEVVAYIKESHRTEQRIQVQPAALADELKSDNVPTILDVREIDEQQIGMIDGALPATHELVQEMLNTWSKDRPIVTCCHHGIRSLEAASFLIGHGFTNVRSLAGGVDAWAQAVDPSMRRY